MRTTKVVGLGLILAFTLSCKKEEGSSDCEKLKGIWQCESWQEDGEEFLGTVEFITSAEIEFKALSGNLGDYEMNISYLIGGSEMIIGAYMVNTSCNQVTITPKSGVPAQYDFHFEGDLLVMEGVVAAVDMRFHFRRG